MRQQSGLDVGRAEESRETLDALFPLVYDELRRLAGAHLRGERPDHTLQPTALVHEAYFRLAGQRHVDWRNRAQFLGVAASMMRRILVNHAHERSAQKRGGGAPRGGRIVELRFFGGLSVDETAHVLGISPATVKRDWSFARAWLRRELHAGCPPYDHGMTTR